MTAEFHLRGEEKGHFQVSSEAEFKRIFFEATLEAFVATLRFFFPFSLI